jgi:hypothetical protein
MSSINNKLSQIIPIGIILGNFTLCGLNGFAQQSKKEEYKKTFYDLKLIPTDSINSFFWGFDFYVNDRQIYYTSLNPKMKEYRIPLSSDSLIKGTPHILNGIYTFEKTQKIYKLIESEKYINGYPVYFSSKHFRNDKLDMEEIIDFEKRHEDQVGSYYSYELSNKGKKTNESWFCRTKSKWKHIPY